MIIDFRADPKFAAGFRVVSARTGEPIGDMIFYADDERGIYRHYLGDEHGNCHLDEVTGEPAWAEVRRAIRIIPDKDR